MQKAAIGIADVGFPQPLTQTVHLWRHNVLLHTCSCRSLLNKPRHMRTGNAQFVLFGGGTLRPKRTGTQGLAALRLAGVRSTIRLQCGSIGAGMRRLDRRSE